MAGEAELEVDDVSPEDLALGEAHLAALGPELPAAPAVDLRGMSLRGGAVRSLNVARKVRLRGWRPLFESLPPGRFSIHHVDRLEPLALALLAVLSKLAEAEAGEPGPRVPMELLRKCQALRARIIAVLEFYFADDTQVMKQVNDIRAGFSNLDLHQDLVRLARLYRALHARLANLPRYEQGDAAKADKLAAELLAAMSQGISPQVEALRRQAAQVASLLAVAHDQVVRGGTFLFWGEPDADVFVSQRSAMR